MNKLLITATLTALALTGCKVPTQYSMPCRIITPEALEQHAEFDWDLDYNGVTNEWRVTLDEGSPERHLGWSITEDSTIFVTKGCMTATAK